MPLIADVAYELARLPPIGRGRLPHLGRDFEQSFDRSPSLLRSRAATKLGQHDRGVPHDEGSVNARDRLFRETSFPEIDVDVRV
jgi:hypothetical protein